MGLLQCPSHIAPPYICQVDYLRNYWTVSIQIFTFGLLWSVHLNFKQEAQRPYDLLDLFARWNQHSFMSYGNVAQVTYFQSATKFLIFGRWLKKSNKLYSPLIPILSIKFGWNWIKTVGGVAFWRSYLTWEILQSALNDPKVNWRNET